MPGHPRPGLRGNINFETCPTYESDRVPALKFLTENGTKKKPGQNDRARILFEQSSS